MREKALRELIDYRMQRAMETLDEAQVMAGMEHWNACTNRLYYAAFYAVSALLIKDGVSTKKHSGIKASFNRHYVKVGKVSKEKGRLYNTIVCLICGKKGITWTLCR